MTLRPPEDRAITTLYIGGLQPGTKEREVRDKFYVHGEIRSIRMVPRQSCAFVTFVNRENAEEAATKLYRILEIGGKKANLMWGRPQASGGATAGEGAASSSSSAGAP